MHPPPGRRVRLSLALAFTLGFAGAGVSAVSGQSAGPAGAAGPVQSAGPAQPPTLAITDVDVLDVRTGEVLRGRTVVVEGERISRVASSSEGVVEATRVIDGAGGLLVPGFVDAHSHLAYVLGDSLSTGGGLVTRLSPHPDSVATYRREHARQYLDWGVTAVRDAGSAEGDVAMLATWQRNPVVWAPDVYASGGALVSHEEGRTPFPGHRVVASPEDARAAVREYHDLGLGHVKLYWRLREPELEAALGEAERLGMVATAHVDYKVVGLERALDLGVRSFEHAYTLAVAALTREEWLAVWREALPASIGDRQEGRFYLGVVEYFNALGPDDPDMARIIERLATTGSTVVPTLHLFAQRLGLAPFASRRLGAFDDLSGLSPAQLERARRGYRILAGYVRRLHEAGVPLAAGTDWIDPGRAVLSELWLLHRAGIPMADTLLIGTLGGAQALGIADRFGAIEPGMGADLVLLHEDPFEDPDALLGPRTVIKDGVVQ